MLLEGYIKGARIMGNPTTPVFRGGAGGAPYKIGAAPSQPPPLSGGVAERGLLAGQQTSMPAAADLTGNSPLD